MIETWLSTLETPHEKQRTRARLLRHGTTWTWFEITNVNHLDDPERPHIVTEMLDISDEMAMHEAIAAREQLLHRLAEALPLGVLQLDADGNVVYKNDALSSIIGAAHATTMDEQFAAVTNEDRPLLQKAFDVALEDASDDDVVVRVEGRRAAGDRLVRVITKALTTTGGEVSGVIACISDVTEATLIGRELERRATYDALTSCLNRAAILSRLESALAAGPGGGAAAVFIDLDGFKSVNDTFGHAVGAEVLATAARVLDATTRSTDVVGRIGGDEFLVVCQDVRDPAMALQLANRIATALRATRVERADVALRGSVGVAWAERGSTDAEQLVRRADEAMYESKREGQGAPHLAV
jgi:diguanylate cyclase (GGDEF)-like protein/PAS domain S-box-containing protein